jgi:hypothetical protein
VTSTFDPDRWYGIQRAALDRRLGNGELEEGDYREEIAGLEERRAEMWRRLDASYRIPDGQEWSSQPASSALGAP